MRLVKRVAVVLAVACIVADLFPRHGPPFFRYPGADLTFEVWNFGWPLALAIYDPRSGWHLFELAHFVIALQALVMVIVLGCLLILSAWLARPRNPSAEGSSKSR